MLKSSFMYALLLFLASSWTWRCYFWPSVGVGVGDAKAPYKETAGRGGAVWTAALPQLQLKVDFSILGEMKAHFSRVALSLASLEHVYCGASDPAPPPKTPPRRRYPRASSKAPHPHRRACLHASPRPSSFLWRTIWTIIESVQRIDGPPCGCPACSVWSGRRSRAGRLIEGGCYE